MKKYHFVYATTNLIDGKTYIGDHSTNDLKDNYLGSGKYFLRVLKKYGKENFSREILEFFNSKQEAFDAQKKYINFFNSLVPNGYNLDPTGGHGANGGFMSEDSRKKLSNSHKGKIPWNKGKKLDPLTKEHREKISKSGKGLKRNDGTKQKIKKSLTGRYLSPEHKKNI